MACLDFVILKVNGVDVSGVSHEEAIRVFLSAHEPITVEVKKRLSTQKPNTPEAKSPKRVSVAVQTDDKTETDSGAIAEEDEPLEELEDEDVDIEEVTLRKSESSERIGLTVTYVAPTRCSVTPPDLSTEVYISNITPDSVAARDGRLRQGDQILQVNGCDVSDKEETESLFAENPNAVTLLVSRCAILTPPEVKIAAITSEIDALDLRVERLMRKPSVEHIYETIPEDETDPEPIYCSPHDSESDRAAQKWRDQLAFEVYADASREQQDKVILGQINRCRWWRPASHEYVELPPSPRREMATSVSSHEVTRVSRVRPSASSATLPAATIYTSPANLENAIAFQERLYRRAMQQRPQATSTETAMEWKVKRRHDGTRYIVRRPIENRRQRDTRPKCRRRHQERPRAENVGLLSVTIV